MQLTKTTLQFLKQLEANNNREWFADNKAIYTQQQAIVKQFLQAVREQLEQTDHIESHKLMRIYRDVRFSKNKAPYNPRFAGSFTRATEQLRGGYFIHIAPNNSFVGGGFYKPNPADLMRIRKEFETDDTEIREIITQPQFVKLFGELKARR